MRTRQSTTRWLGVALACSIITLAASVQAGKPVKPPPTPSTPPYITVPLGGLRSSDGVLNNFASDINNAGQVVGNTSLPGYDWADSSQAYLLNPGDTNGDGKPDTWFVDADSDGQSDLIIGLGTFPACATCNRHTFATAVNDFGLVVGTALEYDFSTMVGIPHAFIVVPADSNGDGKSDCWYQDSDNDSFNDLMVSLGRPPGVPDTFFPTEINLNNAGQVIGVFCDPNGDSPYTGFLLTPVENAQGIWQWFQEDETGANALMVPLEDFLPRSINDSGVIAGAAGWRRAVLRTPSGGMIDLQPGGTLSEAIAINNCGQVGVWWQVEGQRVGDGEGHAGLLTPLDTDNDRIADTWNRDTNGDGINDLIVDLGSLKGLENSYVRPNSLNETGSVLGGSWYAGRAGLSYRDAWLWQNGVLQSLESLTGIEFGDAYAINDAKQIIAEASGKSFNYENGRACILLPTR